MKVKNILFAVLAGVSVLSARAREPIVVVQWQYYPVREQARGYLGRYPDQPLIVDSDLPKDAVPSGAKRRPSWGTYVSMADIDAMYAEGKSYGLNGFAFFPDNDPNGNLWRAKDSSVKGMLTQPIINFWRDNTTELEIDEIEKAVKYRCGAQIDNKALILSYWCDRNNTPEKLAKKLKRAHERLGDTFLFMSSVSWMDGLWDWNETGRVYEKRLEEIKSHFRDVLRVADGILLDTTMTCHTVTNYARTFSGGYHKFMAETARAVVDEPEFKGKKLLGFTLSLGHQNGYHENYTANAIGTETLRMSFEAAIAGRPDVIHIPEWDELNESTGWKPTLCNGYTTKRLFRYYNAVLRKRPLTVMEGDDVTKPNLMLSYRKAVTPGEWTYFEVVNVPDGSRKGSVTVALEVVGEDGRVLAALPARTLREDKLDVTRWDVRSEKLALHSRAPFVRLIVNGKKYEGFHPIDLAPANSWCLKDVKQALRDLAPVAKHGFSKKGRKLAASIDCDEPIRHAMLVGNGWIQYIHNPASYCSRFREDDDHAVFTISRTRGRAVEHAFAFSVPGVSEAEWLTVERGGTGETFAIDEISYDSENVYLRIPKTKLMTAELKIDFKGVLQEKVRLADAYRLGSYGVGAAVGLACVVSRFGLQSRYPAALNAKSCAFTVEPDADRDSMEYHLQVVTMSGKTWRSRPIVSEVPGGKAVVRVWSALQDKCVDLKLPKARIPTLDYDFSPTAGDVIRPRSGERHFFGLLGNAACLATLWNRGSSVEGAVPRGSVLLRENTRPAREQGPDGSWSLVFDGQYNFATFPQETVPSRTVSHQTITFNQAKAGAARCEMLFAARYDNRCGIFNTLIDHGEVVIVGHFTKALYTGYDVKFATGLKVTPETWHTLDLRHTGRELFVTLDGRTVSKAMGMPGFFMTTAILGGSPRPDCSFFTGKVRRLVIDHAYSNDYRVTDYGAKADGSDCTAAFARAIDACAKAGGGRVVVPQGTWHSGPVHLRNDVEFHVAEGARILFTDDPKAYLPPVLSSWEGLECMNLSPLVYACGCTNVALTGKGAIRAKMDFWAKQMEEAHTDIQGARAILYKWGAEDYPVEKRVMPTAHPAVMRPQLVQFNRCQGVRMEDVRVEDSPFWTIHLLMCDSVLVRGIDVCAHGFNNDGVDMEMTQNVLIENGDFDQGDDCFVFKAGRNRDAWRVGRPTANVEIRNCRVKKAGSLVGVGSELSGGIENVYVHDCEVGTVARLYYIKTNHRRGGFVRNVRLENVSTKSVMKVAALETDVLYQWKVFPDYETRITEIDGMYLRNVSCDAAMVGIDFRGDKRLPAKNLHMENVRIGKTQDFLSHVENVENVEMHGVSGGKTGQVKTAWNE